MSKMHQHVIKGIIARSTYRVILASDSLNLTIASNCLTVIGITAASPLSFACFLMSCKKNYRKRNLLDYIVCIICITRLPDLQFLSRKNAKEPLDKTYQGF